ncbi:uncharacterized protein [Clytia hemisphaerica]|uniref:uncharacterized protein n=1 Tax=Clytia hemisphaerica TaxID=252671 RepID=UPI0034D3924E
MAKARNRHIIRTVKILSQNVRGMKNDTRIEILLNVMKERNAIAMCVQETWRSGNELLEHGFFKIVSSGLDESTQRSKRGSQGVSIVLNADGDAAWKAGSYEKHTNFGARVVAIRLLLTDHQKKDVGVFLVSAYAPVGNAPEGQWDLFFDQLTSCISKKQQHDILLVGSDTNSSMGTSSETEDPIGNFGISHINESGKRFRSYLSTNNLTAMTSCFEKKEYATWVHPRSKKKHQIDHFIVNSDMSHRVRDAGITASLLDSDHMALFIKLKLMKRLKKKSEPRQKMINLDLSVLSNVTKQNDFCGNVAQKLNFSTSPGYEMFSSTIKRYAKKRSQRKTKVNPAGSKLILQSSFR